MIKGNEQCDKANPSKFLAFCRSYGFWNFGSIDAAIENNRTRNRKFGIGFRKPRLGEAETERFRPQVRENLSPASLQVRSGNVLVGIHDPNHLGALRKALEETDPMEHDIVALSVNSNVQQPAREITDPAQVMDECETSVFSQVVHEAEKVGKPVWPVAIAGRNCYDLILQAAHQLLSSRVVIGASSKISLSEQQQEITAAWQRLPSAQTLCVEVVLGGNRQSNYFKLGNNKIDSQEV